MCVILLPLCFTLTLFFRTMLCQLWDYWFYSVTYFITGPRLCSFTVLSLIFITVLPSEILQQCHIKGQRAEEALLPQVSKIISHFTICQDRGPLCYSVHIPEDRHYIKNVTSILQNAVWLWAQNQRQRDKYNCGEQYALNIETSYWHKSVYHPLDIDIFCFL